MKLQTWLYEKDNGIAVLTRSSAEPCNIVNNSLLLELDKVIDVIAGDAQVRVLILAGKSVEGDISCGPEPNQLKFEQFLYLLNHVMNKLARLPKTKIAAISGEAESILQLSPDLSIGAEIVFM